MTRAWRNRQRFFFGALSLVCISHGAKLAAMPGMPMAKAPSDSRLQSYTHLRHQLSVLEMAARLQISPDRVYRELSEVQLSLPLDPLRDRATYYRDHLLSQSPIEMAKSLGISPAQVFYELRLQKLSVVPYLLDPLPSSHLQEASRELQARTGNKSIIYPPGTNRWTILQSSLRSGQIEPLRLSSLLQLSPELISSLQSIAGWQLGMPASAWDLSLVFKGESRIRSELIVELAALGYELEEMAEVLNRNTPATHSAHLLPRMIEERMRMLQIPRSLVPPLDSKALLPMQLSNSDRETFALKRVFEFAKSQKRLPQKNDFYQGRTATPEVNLRYSEFIIAFGTQSRAWTQVKERKQEFEKWMGRLPSVRLLDVDFESDPGSDIRTHWQSEVLAEFAQHLKPSSTQLPSRELILKWLGVPFEALIASDEYALGGNFYGMRIFESRARFEKAIQASFPLLKIAEPAVLSSNSEDVY